VSGDVCGMPTTKLNSNDKGLNSIKDRGELRAKLWRDMEQFEKDGGKIYYADREESAYESPKVRGVALKKALNNKPDEFSLNG